MENCAVWMEEMVYPSVNDYLMYVKYGENPLRYPWKDIRSGSMYWYGGVIWPWMMWIKYDENAVREIWEHCAENAGAYMIEAHEEMLADHGTDLEAFFMDYGCWRWFTASFKPGEYGIHWIRLDLAAYQNRSVKMDFNGHDGFEWNLGVIRWETGSDFDFNWYECESRQYPHIYFIEGKRG
ncbi:MAG: hypothetical protein GQ565_07705 [Candidatus Aegiribacteria sp.]|nr:hypothetical protein [Candidatus Aegiribacteria sp.]